MKICVLGLGYIGLPTALMFAKNGHQVLGVDILESKVAALNKGICDSEEEEVRRIFDDEIVRRNFRADTSIRESDVFIISVPTPVDHAKKADLSFVIDATRSILNVLQKGNFVIVESTVPPGTCRDVVRPILEKSGLIVSKDIFLAHCPEQILIGNSIHELQNNPKIVGGMDSLSTTKAKVLYQSFVRAQIYTTNDVTAELAKVAANAYRDINIAFANELAQVCEKLGISSSEVIALANSNPRVHIHKSGIGVGGHCIPIDPLFIAQLFPNDSKIISIARSINDNQPYIIVDKILNILNGLANKKILICGIAYKPNVKDLRESPALVIIDQLRKRGYTVATYDPLVYAEHSGKLVEFARNNDVLIVLVPHDSIMKELEYNYEEIRTSLNSQVILSF